MTAEPGGRAPDDDVVDLPDLDLDARPDPDDDTTDPGDRGTPTTGSRLRWLAIPLILLLGGVLGAYIVSLRSDAAAAGTVSLQFGGIDTRSWSYPSPGQPLRAGIHLLNTGAREVALHHISVPGLEDDDIPTRTRDADETTALPPGEWVMVPIVRDADCSSLQLGTAQYNATRSITVAVELDGQRSDITVQGPMSGADILQDVLPMLCSDVDENPHLSLQLLDAGAPADGAMTMRWQNHPFGDIPDNDLEVTSIQSTTPGLVIEVAAAPFSLSDDVQFDAVWTVEDCDELVDPANAQLYVQFAQADGTTNATSTGLDSGATFALGALIADTCGTENGLGPGTW